MSKSKKKKINFQARRRAALKPDGTMTVHKSTRKVAMLCTGKKSAPKTAGTCYYWIGVDCHNCKRVAGRV